MSTFSYARTGKFNFKVGGECQSALKFVNGSDNSLENHIYSYNDHDDAGSTMRVLQTVEGSGQWGQKKQYGGDVEVEQGDDD